MTVIDPATDPNRDKLSLGVRALTEGFVQGTSARAGHFNPKLGKYIVTYTFEKDKDDVDAIPFDDAQKKAALDIMDEMKRIANIEFVPAKNREEADFRFIQTNLKEALGEANTIGEHRDIKLDPGQKQSYEKGAEGYRILAHEMLHGLGFDHPLGSPRWSYHPNFDIRDSLLSYNKLHDYSSATGFGVDDIAAMQYIYEKSKNYPHDITAHIADMATTRTIYADGITTIDLRRRKIR